jgi:hypothetical protein
MYGKAVGLIEASNGSDAGLGKIGRGELEAPLAALARQLKPLVAKFPRDDVKALVELPQHRMPREHDELYNAWLSILMRDPFNEDDADAVVQLLELRLRSRGLPTEKLMECFRHKREHLAMAEKPQATQNLSKEGVP